MGGVGSNSSQQVLIVEDDADISMSLRQFLELEGYDGIVARNGKEALELLAHSPEPVPALILLDLMMPVMDGWQFLQAQQNEPQMAQIPVIVMSAARVIDPLGSARNVVATLRKPIDLDQLVALLKAHCRLGPNSALG